MQSTTGGSLLGMNLVYLAFLLVPGFMALQGYLRGSVQLDTLSRLDKILSAVVGGSISMAIMLVLNRFGILHYIVIKWYNLIPGGTHYYNFAGVLGYSQGYAVMTGTITGTTALSLIGFIFGQSGIAWFIGYLYGTIIYSKGDGGRLRVDLEQPWETAVANGSYGEKVVVITKNGQEIHGRLDRIGSPSEDNDLLLFAATKKVSGKEDEPLGQTYHHYRDISQVRFPDLAPSEPDKRGNWLLEKVPAGRAQLQGFREVPSKIRYQYHYHRYRSRLPGDNTIRGCLFEKLASDTDSSTDQAQEEAIQTAVNRAKSLKRWVNE